MKSTIKIILIYFGDLFSVLACFVLSLGYWGVQTRFLSINNIMIYNLLILFLLFNIVFFIVKYHKDSIFNFDSFSAIALGASIFIIFALFYILVGIVTIPINLSTILTSFVFCCFVCGTYRIFIIVGRKALLRFKKYDIQEQEKNIIIFGAGEAGKFLANMLAYDRSKKIKIVAYIDDNKQLHGRRIKGYPVVGDRNSISAAVKKYKADQIIIAIPHVDNSNFREIVELSCKSGCKVRRFANMSDLNMNDLSKATINDVNIDDLLGREPIKLDLRDVRELLKDKVVMVTGGAGSIGSEICRQVLSYDIIKVIIFDLNENDLFKLGNELSENYDGKFNTVVGSIKDKARLDEVMEKYKPNIIFHAAAYKHVPMMESNPIEAVANNVFGTENVMISAIEHNVENFTMISTDKAVNPTNIMGATKRITELLCKYMSAKGKTKFSAVRFGNVLGSNGSVIPIFEEQIRKGGPIKVTDKDIQRYFMTIPEAVQLVMEASSISKGGELFVLDMGTMIKIYDLATTMIRLSGLEPEKDIKIEISGLRPGEKMYEEIQMNSEILTKTENNRIFIFDSELINIREFEYELMKLRIAIKNRNMKTIFAQIKTIVPTYTLSEFLNQRTLNDELLKSKADRPIFSDKPQERVSLTAS